MNKENTKLGRGLSSLLSSGKEKQQDSKIFKIVSISSIEANLQQPRKKFGKNVADGKMLNENSLLDEE